MAIKYGSKAVAARAKPFRIFGQKHLLYYVFLRAIDCMGASVDVYLSRISVRQIPIIAPHCSSFHQVLRLLVRTYNILYVICITFMKYVKPSGKIAQINPLHITIVSLRNRTLLRALCGRLVGLVSVTFVFNKKIL